MSEHHAAIRWRRETDSFAYEDYNRAHEWLLSERVRVPASAAPEFHLEKNAEGRLAVTRVELRPRVVFAGDPPAADELARIHDMSHRECFIANSVTTDVRVVAD